MSEDFWSKLNKKQKQAIEYNDSPLLIVAGAGTGKTTVLINKLLYLIKEKEVNPENILLTTFTEKGAQEMTERADKALPYGYFNLWINTFHGFCERILRDHGLDIGLPIDFKLLNQTQQWILIKENLYDFNLDYFKPLGNPNKFIHELLKHFSRLKDENITSGEYLDYAKSLEENTDSMLSGLDAKERDTELKKIQELAHSYHYYNQLLLDNSFLDFGDLLTYTLKLFKERPAILKTYQQQFKYVMVDEFQDTNWSQYEIIKQLSLPENNLTVVGDDDQSIYRFRGSSIFNIMQFKDDYKEAKEIVLTDNYRSGQKILDKSYELIKNNDPYRLETKLDINKKLISNLDYLGQIEHWNLETESQEIKFVVEKIKELYEKDKDSSWSDFAILIRANNTADKFVKELSRQKIPNLFVSLKGLYYKPIILEAINYFKLLDNYHESSALFKVLNSSTFKIPYEDIININKFARRKTFSLFEALKNIQAVSKDLHIDTPKKIEQILKFIEKHSEQVKTFKPSQIFLEYIKDFGIIKNLDKDINVKEYSYLDQFYKKIKDFESVQEDVTVNDFVQLLNLEFEAGESGTLRMDFEDPEVVKIMTVHSAKGLEFNYVFLVNLVDRKFPTDNRKDKITIPEDLIREQIEENKDAHLQEERRLFYVAVTRGKKAVFLTSAKNYGGATEKKPSKFIEELNLQENKKEFEDLSELEKDLQKDSLADLPKNLENLKNYLPQKFSFSQLEAYSKCPLQYFFAFILRIPIEEKDNFIFGRLMHNCLFEFFLPLIENNVLQANLFENQTSQEEKNKYITKERLFDIYKDKWRGEGYSSKKTRDEYYKKGRQNLQNLYQHIEEKGIPNILWLEKQLTTKIKNESLIGTADRIDKLEDGSLEIVDYKTGAAKGKKDLTFDLKRQLLLYKIAVEEIINVKVNKLTFFYLENGEPLSFEPKEKDVEKFKQQVIDEISQIRELNFNPKPSVHTCKYCDFKNICKHSKAS